MKERFESKTDLCLCGIGTPNDVYCKEKTNPNQSEGMHKKFMHELDEKRRHYKRLCLHPKQDECCDVKTDAHTISQQAVLSLIAENGEVLMPVVYGITNELEMKPMGIEAKATKFYCFCQTHDAMFYTIDQRAVTHNEHTFFLYAYRTFASTYYKVIRELDCYEALRQEYDLTCNPLVVLFYLQTQNSLPALNWYKDKFDKAILTEKYDCLESASVTLGYRAYFAAATCFCPMFDVFGNLIFHSEFDLPMIYISIIPDENQTHILFSWFKEDRPIYGLFSEQLKVAPTRLTLKYLNNLIPLNCENMTVGPLLWNKWDATAKEDFLKVTHDHLKNEDAKNASKIYFRERAYNLFLQI